MVLSSTRDAETAFDIIFVINVVLSFLTVTDQIETEHIGASDLRPVFAEIAKKYLR
jgi:hypothetical protein